VSLRITPEARAYLIGNYAAAVTLRASPRHGCCGGTVLLPVVEPGAPEDVERYGAPEDAERWACINVDGVQVFVEAGIEIPQGALIQIGVDRFLKWHRLWIEGLEW
jgi:hypothetical protein